MRKFKNVVICAVAIILVFSLSGCALLESLLDSAKREIVGEEMTVTTYDHYGNPTLKVKGTKIHVGLLTNNANFDTESTGFESEVLEITVNGNQMFQVGNTLIVEEKGLNKVTDFEMPEDIEITAGGGFMYFDRLVNDYANKIGEEKTVLVSSQLGIPIAVYQGKDVYVEVPDDLPKMTLLSIDGKALYIGRANYCIIDSDMIAE